MLFWMVARSSARLDGESDEEPRRVRRGIVKDEKLRATPD